MPNAPITIGIIVTFLFYSFFYLPSKVAVLFLLFTFFQFYTVVSRYCKAHNFASSLFFCRWLLWGLVIFLRFGDPFVCQSNIGVCVHHSPRQLLGCANNLHFYIRAVLVADISLEGQISSCIQYISNDTSQFQQCGDLHMFDSSSYFHFHKSFFKHLRIGLSVQVTIIITVIVLFNSIFNF